MNPQLVNRVRPGVVVSTILDPETEQAQTVIFRADKTARVGFTTEVTYGPGAQHQFQHNGAVLHAAGIYPWNEPATKSDYALTD